MTNVFKKLSDIVLAAGDIISGQKAKSIESKGEWNYITEADKAVSRFLEETLPGLIPGSIVVSEEAEPRDYSFVRPTWIIDPIDGTTNFIYGLKSSAVSVGLVYDGDPKMGAVYNPDSKELFMALSGSGATLNGKEIHVNSSQSVHDSLIGFGTTPYDKRKFMDNLRLFTELYQNCIDMRRSGSAALDLCYVASGRYSAFYELDLKPWDFAAGTVILREAGGRVTTLDNGIITLKQNADILATNSIIHDEILALISPGKPPEATRIL